MLTTVRPQSLATTITLNPEKDGWRAGRTKAAALMKSAFACETHRQPTIVVSTTNNEVTAIQRTLPCTTVSFGYTVPLTYDYRYHSTQKNVRYTRLTPLLMSGESYLEIVSQKQIGNIDYGSIIAPYAIALSINRKRIVKRAPEKQSQPRGPLRTPLLATRE